MNYDNEYTTNQRNDLAQDFLNAVDYETSATTASKSSGNRPPSPKARLITDEERQKREKAKLKLKRQQDKQYNEYWDYQNGTVR